MGGMEDTAPPSSNTREGTIDAFESPDRLQALRPIAQIISVKCVINFLHFSLSSEIESFFTCEIL